MQSQPVKLRLKGLALPNEHGSWGFLFEPIVAAAAIAFSPAAPWLALTVIGAFLVRQPLKVFISDKLAGRSLAQTDAALRYAAAFAVAAGTGLLMSLWLAPAASFIPFALVLPLGVYQIYCDVSRKTREILPEITGAVAMSSSAGAIAIAGGMSGAATAALWLFLIARLVPSILYVRQRLRLEKGKDFSLALPVGAHFMAFGGVAYLAVIGLLPYLVLPIFAMLLARCIYGLSSYRTKMKAMKIGVWEVIYGVLTVLSLIVGYYMQI